MIVYRDMTFCGEKCGNMECERNQKHIPEEVFKNLPISFANFKDWEECIGWEEEK